MASFFRNSVINNIGTTPVIGVETASNARATLIGLSLANLTDGIVLVDITLQDSSENIGYYVKQLIIPPNASLRVINGGEKLIMATSNILSINANVDNAVDAIISYVELI
jgi:hypothetical protein